VLSHILLSACKRPASFFPSHMTFYVCAIAQGRDVIKAVVERKTRSKKQ
jgi:hypothetical protein